MVNQQQNFNYRLLTLDYLFTQKSFDPYSSRLSVVYKKFLAISDSIIYISYLS